jgi:hypothetical protein
LDSPLHRRRLLVGKFLPEFGQFMGPLKFAQLSIPIGISCSS